MRLINAWSLVSLDLRVLSCFIVLGAKLLFCRRWAKPEMMTASPADPCMSNILPRDQNRLSSECKGANSLPTIRREEDMIHALVIQVRIDMKCIYELTLTEC
jgi:hypothetical protein